MPAVANLVHQQSASTGTGDFTLAAVNGKQSFDTAFGHGATTDVFDYFISNRDASEWERGTGHLSDATTLVRDTVLESTNSNAAVSFSAGTKDVMNDVPAAKQVTTDDLVNLSALQSVNGGQLAGFRNLLINADGRLNQRAPTSNADNTYGHDRWVVHTQTSTIAVSTISNPENGTPRMWRLTQSQATAQRMGYAQWVESANCQHLRGKNVTLSGRIQFSLNAAIRYAICEWTGTEDTLSTARDVVNSWTNSTFTAGNFFKSTTFNVLSVGSITPAAATLTDLTALTATVGNSCNNLVVFIWTESAAAQSATLDGSLQLEVGSVASAMEFRPSGTELALCNRYYAKTFPLSIGPNDNVTIAGAFAIVPLAATGYLAGQWSYPQRMRAIPTIGTYNPSPGTASYWSNAAQTSTSKPLVTSTGDVATQVYLNNASSASWTSQGWLIQLTADAEL
jgi:hypothetical protein